MNKRVLENYDVLREMAHGAPQEPGVYLMRDGENRIIYIGKARILKNRLSSYFAGGKDIKTATLLRHVRAIETIIVANEYEALLLENTLIKQHSPKYNINLKDGKTYPVIRITAEEFPRVFRTRHIIEDGSRYFGPFPNIPAVDTMLDLVDKLFPLRKCRAAWHLMKKRKNPCMYYHIGRCEAPCCGRISAEKYAETVKRVEKLVSGETESLVIELTERMHESARELKFERAAQIRNAVKAIGELSPDITVVDFDPEGRDYIAWAGESVLTTFTVFSMRGGKMTGRELFRTRSAADEQDSLETFIASYYAPDRPPPPRIYLSFVPGAAGAAAATVEEKSLTTDHTDHTDEEKNLATGPLVRDHTDEEKDLTTDHTDHTDHTDEEKDLATDEEKELTTDHTGEEKNLATDEEKNLTTGPLVRDHTDEEGISDNGSVVSVRSVVDFPHSSVVNLPHSSVVELPHSSVVDLPHLSVVNSPHSNDESALDGIRRWFREQFGYEPALLPPAERRHKAVIALARQNAEEDIRRRLKERGAGPALDELRQALSLKNRPERIEGFDIAQLDGKHPVASLISFKDGVPDRKNYRYFKLRSVVGVVDDFAAMREAVYRRYSRLIREGKELPDLVLIDGGIGQVNAARGVMDELGMDSDVAGLAKRDEELWLPHAGEPVRLSRRSEALKVLQFVRDETHRFATTFNQKLRSKDLLFPTLESIEGIGPKRAAAIMEAFVTLEAVAAADPEVLAEKCRLGENTARAVRAAARLALEDQAAAKKRLAQGLAGEDKAAAGKAKPYYPLNSRSEETGASLAQMAAESEPEYQ